MKNLIYKLLFIFSNPLKIIWNTFKKFTSFLGGLVTLFSILDSIYGNRIHTDFLLSKILVFILITLIIGLILSINWIPKISYKINETDSRITIKVGDITRYKKAIIISTNTSFVTQMENNVISSTSTQGCFQNKLYKNNTNELNKLIKSGLSMYTPMGKILKLNTDNKKYPIYEVGTVSKFINNNRNVYFLGLNDINSSGQNKERNCDDFFTALDKLWIFIRQKGNTEEAAIHLIGSGHAGLSEITKEQSLKEIIKSYIGQIQNYKILTELIIYIYPTDLKYIKINKIKKFTENQCIYAEKRNKQFGKEDD